MYRDNSRGMWPTFTGQILPGLLVICFWDCVIFYFDVDSLMKDHICPTGVSVYMISATPNFNKKRMHFAWRGKKNHICLLNSTLLISCSKHSIKIDVWSFKKLFYWIFTGRKEVHSDSYAIRYIERYAISFINSFYISSTGKGMLKDKENFYGPNNAGDSPIKTGGIRADKKN